jgi:NAD-dependent SIR2 family protein deacetylase
MRRISPGELFGGNAMRFLANGADIPDKLIRAVTDGNAVFLCGAGVSRRSNMPSFRGLTEHVYKKLGETHANEPAERIAFECKEYDRALRSLEKRTHRPQTESRVRTTVAQLLTAPDGVEVPDHLALLQLSRDNEGRPKLLTTNFDTLFERAARKAGLLHVPSHAAKSIPKPGGARDHGILHLHGRIADTKLGLEETDLILTSADFGDAYLRDGGLPSTWKIGCASTRSF